MSARGEIIKVGHHDGRFIRAPGVFILTGRRPGGSARPLYVGEAADIARGVGAGGAIWCEAIALGFVRRQHQ